jgi:fructose-specific component phosphotransferase system IIB-like protein
MKEGKKEINILFTKEYVFCSTTRAVADPEKYLSGGKSNEREYNVAKTDRNFRQI